MQRSFSNISKFLFLLAFLQPIQALPFIMDNGLPYIGSYSSDIHLAQRDHQTTKNIRYLPSSGDKIGFMSFWNFLKNPHAEEGPTKGRPMSATRENYNSIQKLDSSHNPWTSRYENLIAKKSIMPHEMPHIAQKHYKNSKHDLNNAIDRAFIFDQINDILANDDSQMVHGGNGAKSGLNYFGKDWMLEQMNN